jgi:hypothetical protein
MSDEEAAQSFVNHMLTQTARLVRLASGETLKAIASGFWVPVGRKYRLISAGHAIGASPDWAVETIPVSASETLALSLKGVRTLTIIKPKCESGSLDIAWADIDPDELKADLQADPHWSQTTVELPLYIGPLDSLPTPGVSYGFAAWNRVELHPALATLRREASYELCLEYTGVDSASGLYRFRIARQHQGHDYYRGASGAPIADTEGRYVSMLVCGDPGENVLFGVPLAQHAAALQAT